MANFPFRQTKLDLYDRTNIDFSTGTFYAALVTAEPADTITLRSSLTEVVPGNYAPVALTGRSSSLIGAQGTLTFSSPVVFNNLWANTSAPVTGMVICKQSGGSPATSDRVISYLERTIDNAAATIASVTTVNGQPVLTAANGAFTNVVIGATITGTGIPASTTVTGISSDGSALLLSADCTAAGTVTVTTTTRTATPRTMPTAVGDAINLSITIPSTGIYSIT